MHEDFEKQCLVVFMSSNVERGIRQYSREARDWLSSSSKWPIAMTGACSSLTMQGDEQVLTEDKKNKAVQPLGAILQTRCSSRQNDLKLQEGTEAIQFLTAIIYMYIYPVLKRQDCPCMVERGYDGMELCLSFCVLTMAESREELGSSIGLPTRLTVCTVPNPCSYNPSFWKGPACKAIIIDLQGETARETIGSPWRCAYGVSKLCVLSNETVGFQKNIVLISIRNQPRLLCLHIWSLAADGIWGGYGTFRRCILGGGNASLGVGCERWSDYTSRAFHPLPPCGWRCDHLASCYALLLSTLS